ncbi:MAG: erythromycin esterase family protein [Saprospiraceae bacterium]
MRIPTPLDGLPVLILLGLFASSLNVFAQQPLNLGFEKTSVEGAARPWGWSPFQLGPNTVTSLDSLSVHDGKYSLRLSNEALADDGTGGDHTLGYWLSPYELLGKKLTLAGWAKTEKTGGAAQVILAAYGDTGLVKEAKSIDFKGVGDWQPFTLELSGVEAAHSFFIIVGTNGSGKVWFDGFQLNVDGTSKQALEVADNFTPPQRKWLKENATPFKTCKPSPIGEKADFSDLEFFRQAVGEAKVIALGEATHGTSEFFQLKHRLLQYAVEVLNVRVFAIEANQLEVEKINRYVCGGEGTAEQVIKVMFRVWNTEEMLTLIEWLRAYNLQNPRQMVEFVGFDLQDPSLPMDSLSHFIGDVEPALQALVDSLQRNYREAWRAQYYPQAADSIRLIWKENAEQILALVSSKKQTWQEKAKTAASKKRLEWALQNARVVVQAADIAYSQIVSARDTFMAENIRWIQSQRPLETRIIVWAHDSHIARSDSPDFRYNYHQGESMGKYLSRMYGSDYRAFGLFTYGGQYSATVSFTNHNVVPVDAMNAPRGSFDEGLHGIAGGLGSGQLFLDLRPAFKLKNNGWLLQPRPVRFVGYATSDYDFGAVMSVPYQFDGLFFVDKTGASKMLR